MNLAGRSECSAEGKAMSEVERVLFAIGVTVMVVAGMIALMRGESIVYTLGELSQFSTADIQSAV